MNRKYEFGKKDIVSTIILENYERFFESKSHLVPSKNIDNILNTIEKMKPCKDKKLAFSQYICPNCYQSHKIAFSCKSRFCNSCGKVYADKWIEKQKDLMLDVKHRHMVFTIPHKFRIHIYKNFSIIKLLFNACFNVILGSLNSSFKTTKKSAKKFLKLTKGISKPAFICVLHTFGRDLKFNPHFHVIVAEGGFKNDGSFKKVKYFNYKGLRASWRKLFLDTFKNFFQSNPKIKKLINSYYNSYDGFYVRAKDTINNINILNEYLGRYLSRPPISSKNILSYSKYSVTFRYVDHKTKKEVVETIDTLDFLGRLFYHVLPKGFKSIRRFGAYARNLGKSILKGINSLRLINRKLFLIKKSKLNYALRLKMTYGIDPFICPKCSTQMILLDIWHHKYGVIFSIFNNESSP